MQRGVEVTNRKTKTLRFRRVYGACSAAIFTFLLLHVTTTYFTFWTAEAAFVPHVWHNGRSSLSTTEVSEYVRVMKRKNCLSVLFMGKGDGKKRRKKKSAMSNQDSSDDGNGAEALPAPQRVTSNSLVSVRRQIRYAKMKKELMSSSTSFRSTAARTAYRKKGPVGPDELAEARQARKEKATDDWAAITNSTSSPLFIVDGYNVIYQWPRLKKHMLNGNPKRARDLLINDLEELRVIKGWRIEVVFDGRERSTKGVLGDSLGGERITAEDRANSVNELSKGVRVVYSGIGTSADTYIESRCFEAKNVTKGELTGSLIVATDDNMIRVVAMSAGAVLVSSNKIVQELKVVRKAIMFKIESALAKESGRPVAHPSLREEKTTFKMGKVEVVDKRNTKNTRQERWRKKIEERNAARERMLSSLQDEGKVDDEVIQAATTAGNRNEEGSRNDFDEKENNISALDKKQESLQKLTHRFENPDGMRDTPKKILHEFYQTNHENGGQVKIKEHFFSRSKRCDDDAGIILWNTDFTCPITKSKFCSGLVGDPKRYVIDKNYFVWHHSKKEAENSAAHTALKSLLYE